MYDIYFIQKYKTGGEMKMNSEMLAVLGSPITGDQGTPWPIIICLAIAVIAIIAVVVIPKMKKK